MLVIMATVVMALIVRILTNVPKEATTATTMPLAQTLMDHGPVLATLVTVVLVRNTMMLMSMLPHFKVKIVL